MLPPVSNTSIFARSSLPERPAPAAFRPMPEPAAGAPVPSPAAPARAASPGTGLGPRAQEALLASRQPDPAATGMAAAGGLAALAARLVREGEGR